MDLEVVGIAIVYAAMAVYTISMLAFAIDLFGLGTRPEGAPRRAGGIGMSTAWLAGVLHLASLVVRTVDAGRVPWANMYEFTLMFTFFVIAAFLGLNIARDMRFLGVLVTLLNLLGLGLATSVLYVKAEGIEPILDDYWLVIHVSVATLSTALLYLGAALAILQLAQHRAERLTTGAAPVLVREPKRKGSATSRVRNLAEEQAAPSAAAVGATATAVLDAPADTDTGDGKSRAFLKVMGSLPPAAKFEIWAYRIVGVGFVTWTFTIIAGAIWAEHAWGRPWGWDPKETWSFVVWIIYAAYLHARATVGWTAEKFAYFLLIGFAALLVNFYVVNLFIPGNHSYAY